MKIGLDADDDLFVRVESKSKSVDLEEFRLLMHQNVNAAEAIKPYLPP